jgi:hypothetical protein
MRGNEPFHLIDAIMAYEAGEATGDEVLALFAHLVKTRQAWMLQGHYGRTADALIDAGYIDEEGNIL